ncbi:hypothetical protein F0Q45_12390 [Mycobacterium simiae]|uniref:Beta-ketoacyl-[acyl-carrier-protein] synthase III C-terminal domain-containing protein n=1 Tax=Mycobacterium simiae TaxID=1784 RepID=A0A5B1BPE9_MYCSI|nr:3-oxoacyl-[acyl-carrier-protein] synthase III C-terminal domain-containing protein [Mycobacterium simiae]KAA1249952.1 hypothetical protein F0Q45_12390 [Mycobacterium simiae]
MLWDGVFINSIGTYLPRRVPVETLGCDPPVKNGYAYGGYESFTVSDIPGHVMAGLAAKQAVENSNHRGEMFSPIVYADMSLIQEHMIPVCYVQRILRQRDSLAFVLNAGCDGGCTAIETVARILSNSPDVNAGLVCAALRWRPDGGGRWSASTNLIADGAAAAIISKKEGFARLIVSQVTSEPDLEGLLQNRVTQPGIFDIPMVTDGIGAYAGTVTQSILTAISATLAEAKISIEDIAYFCTSAPHLASLEELFLRPTGIPIEKTCWSELRKIGHVGPCDQILGLAHLVATGQLKPGQFVMLVGGGGAWRVTCLLLQVV